MFTATVDCDESKSVMRQEIEKEGNIAVGNIIKHRSVCIDRIRNNLSIQTEKILSRS